jgi:hypothetical protein
MSSINQITPCRVKEFSAEINDNLYQEKEQDALSPPLLQMPFELLTRIGQFIAEGRDPQDMAKNIVNFGRVSVLTHLVTHDADSIFESIIWNGKKYQEITDSIIKSIEAPKHHTFYEFGFDKWRGTNDEILAEILHDSSMSLKKIKAMPAAERTRIVWEALRKDSNPLFTYLARMEKSHARKYNESGSEYFALLSELMMRKPGPFDSKAVSEELRT